MQAGTKVEILSRDPHRVAVGDIVRLYLVQAREPELLQRAMNVSTAAGLEIRPPAAGHEWKERDGCPYRVLTGIEAAPSTRPCRGS